MALAGAVGPIVSLPDERLAPSRPVAGRRGVGMRRAIQALQVRGDDGMTVAEYAVGTVAACGFGGVLYKILTSTPVISMVTDLISKALPIGLF
jgi:hypothetical protein